MNNLLTIARQIRICGAVCKTTKVVFDIGLPLCHFVTSPLIKGRQEEDKLNIEPTAVVLLAPLTQLKKSVKIQVSTTIFVLSGLRSKQNNPSELTVSS